MTLQLWVYVIISLTDPVARGQGHPVMKPEHLNKEELPFSATRESLRTPVFLPGESQGRGSLVGCRLWGYTESDTTEAT